VYAGVSSEGEEGKKNREVKSSLIFFFSDFFSPWIDLLEEEWWM